MDPVEQVGPYQVLAKIGRGGMGRVFKAVDPRESGTLPLALKILRKGSAGMEASDISLWGRELEALSGVGHPNIVRLLDFGEDEDSHYLVMEFLDGPTLDEFCKGGNPGISATVRLARQMASALKCAHERNIIHLDLKPQNVVLTGTPPSPKILDFGLSRYVTDLAEGSGSEVSGSFAYMAPEQLRAERAEFGPHTDLYALGVILFEMLAGESPYETRDVGELVRRKIAGDHRRLPDIVAGLPTALDRIVSHLLDPDRRQRYCTAEGLLHDLDRCLEALEQGEAEFDFPIGERDVKPVSALDVRFIGRAAELARLVELYGECSRGKGQVVFVTGSAGIGKSRLVAEFRNVVRAKGARAVAGKGTRNTRNIPYYPILTAIGDYLDRTAAAPGLRREAGFARRREQFISLLDLLQGKQSSGELQPDIEHGRERFFHLIMNTIAGMASPGNPLVLVLDDLQWADHGTIEFIERVAARMVSVPVMVVGLFRDDELDPQQQLPRTLRKIDKYSCAVPVTRLSRSETVELIVEMLGAEPDHVDSLASFLVEHASGNPFNTVALTASLVEEEVLTQAADAWRIDNSKLNQFVSQGKPARFVETLIEVLSPSALKMLEWAAVLGHEFDSRMLHRLIETPPETLSELLGVARNQGIVHRLEGQHYCFAHDNFREHVYEKIAWPERRTRHQRVAALMEEILDAEDSRVVLDLAEHYSRGTDVEKALDYAIRAGDIARRSHAHDSAKRYMKSALMMLRAVKWGEEKKNHNVIVIRRTMGDAYAATGDYDLALEQYSVAQELAGESIVQAELGGRKAVVYFMRGELEVAAKQMEEALGLLGVGLALGRVGTVLSILSSSARLSLTSRRSTELAQTVAPQLADDMDRLQVMMLTKLTFIYFFFNIERTLAIHLVSLCLSERIRPCPESVEAIGQHAVLACSVPLHKRALRYATAVTEMADRLEEPGARMTASFYAGACHSFLARWSDAEVWLRAVVGLFQQTGDIFTLELAHENLGSTHFHRARFETAAFHFRKALDLSQEVGDHRGEAVAHLFLARIHRIKGNLDSARENGARALNAIREVKDNSLEAGGLYASGVVTLALDQREEGLDLLERSRELVEKHKLMQEYVAPVYATLAEALLLSEVEFAALPQTERRRITRRVKRLLRRSQGFARRFPAHTGPTLRVRGVLELRLGRPGKARRFFRKSAAVLRDLDMRFQLARTYAAWSAAYEEGDPGRAGTLNMAHALAREIGAAEAAAGLTDRPEELPADSSQEGAALPGAAQIGSLIEVGKVLASTLELEVLLEKTMVSVMEVAGAERGFLLLDEGGGGELRVAVARHLDGPKEDAGKDSFSSSIIELVIRTGEPILVSDAMMDPRFMAAESVFAHQLRSVLCFPLTVRGRARGVIYLENNAASNCFGQSQLDVIRIFAAQASIALANGLAYREIEELNRELEAKVEQRTAELRKTSDDLQDKNVELEDTITELQETRDRMVQQEKMASLGEMAAGATHEINNPLNFIQAGAFSVRKKLAVLKDSLPTGGSFEEMEGRLDNLIDLSDVIGDGCRRIEAIVDGLWAITDQRRGEPESVDLNDGLESTAKFVTSTLGNGVELVLTPGRIRRVRGFSGELNQVLLNLVLNAAEALNGPGRIAMRTYGENDEVCVEVSDSGPGLPAGEPQRVFDPFYTTKQDGRGRGLGLAICMRIVEQHGGTIMAGSSPAGGAVFTMRLPGMKGIVAGKEEER